MPSSTNDCTPIQFFREAAPYIQAHKGKTFVIAISSETIASERFKNLTKDIAILSTLGVKIVLVHGTRCQIDREIKQQGVSSQFHKKLRVTTPEILKISESIVGRSRVQIESLLSHALNMPPVINHSLAVISGSFVTAKPIGIHDGVDYQHTGHVRKIATEQIQQQLDHQNIVLISPLGSSPTGTSYNLHYEEVATQTAKALQADKLIFLVDSTEKLPKELSLAEAQKNKTISQLLPHLDKALQTDVSRIHLIAANQDGSLLEEVYTRDGSGTLISTNSYDELTRASIEDISGILDLIRPLEQKGVLIKRSREQLELEVDNFIVLKRDQKVIGCVALYPMSIQVCELACLVVDDHYRGQNKGDVLLQYAEKQALSKGVEQLLVLTTQTTDWFQERGFTLGKVSDLPSKKKQLYNYQRNSNILLKSI